MNTASLTPFNGSNYDHTRDAPRLTDQMSRVFHALSGKQWHTLESISQITGDPTPSISAQIRHLRKARFGGWEILKIHQGNGLFAYRMTGGKVEPASEPPADPTSLPPAAPEKLRQAEIYIARLESQLEGLESFHCDIVAGCDIDKGSQGLFRQKRVVIGPGKTQDEIDLERAEAKCDELISALHLILDNQPAGSSTGECFRERFDPDGEPIGVEHLDPLSVIQNMVAIAEEGLNRAARLGPQISPTDF